MHINIHPNHNCNDTYDINLQRNHSQRNIMQQSSPLESPPHTSPNSSPVIGLKWKGMGFRSLRHHIIQVLDRRQLSMLKQQGTSIFKNLTEGNREEWTEMKPLLLF